LRTTFFSFQLSTRPPLASFWSFPKAPATPFHPAPAVNRPEISSDQIGSITSSRQFLLDLSSLQQKQVNHADSCSS
jgi:hypothetical protein